MLHEDPPIPPDPESERRGHELRDVAIRPIVIFLIGLFVFGGVVQAAMSLLMTGYVAGEAKIAIPKIEILSDTGAVGTMDRPGSSAPLQRDTTADMLRMYAEDKAALGSFGRDEKTGKIHIPIKDAMESVAKKGLPHRDTPKSSIDPELPYPKRSKPYMATP